QRFAGQRLLVICHAGVMRLLLTRARGLPRERLLEVVVAHGELLPLDAHPAGAPAAVEE
ncbi:histidine phosphatase family protein, partial [Klebsiella pneumoniae]|nr:histidine phosphatase family protein [Klebsiella pneumoniae]